MPRLTEADIRELADDLSFERGMEYYLHGAIQNPVRQGSELRAECEGSQGKPYQVRVVLSKGATIAASCSCPRGGFCKHIVALLLHYIHRPSAFREVPPLETVLASLTRDDLAGLVEAMVQREPSLMALVDEKTGPAPSPVDVTALRRKIERALHRRSTADAVEDLLDLLATGDDLLKKEDRVGAGTVYQEVLSALAASYDGSTRDGDMDAEDDLAVIANESVSGLRECLERVGPGLAVRRSWLAAVLEAQLTDIALGGVGFASGASRTLIEQASCEEWPSLEKRLLEIVPGSHEWERQTLVEILVGWNEGHGRSDQAKHVTREFGTPEQRVFFLVRDGKPDEAVALAMEGFADMPGVILHLADALVESDAKEAATALVTRQAESKASHPRYLEWLALRCCKDNDLEAALTWQRAYFMERPAVETFKAMRKIARRVGCWNEVRASALRELEQKKEAGPLIEIALHERNVARALELLPLANRHWHDYRSDIARVAEKEHPLQAMTLYQGLAEDAIARRQREAYAQATKFLLRAKMLAGRLGRGEEWRSYITALRNEHPRLRALQDEMKRTGL